MKRIGLIFIFFLSFYLRGSTQENLYTVLSIPEELKQQANAVVRLNEMNVDLKSSSKMEVSVKRIITVFNKQGERNIDAYVNYDKGLGVNSLEAKIYDAFGKEIKKIKKKDFVDQSAVDGGTLYSDARVKYLDYTAISYPYTVEVTYETVTKNTAFIPWFYPLDAYYLSIQKSIYRLNNPTGINIRFKELNCEDFNIKRGENITDYQYAVEHLKAIKPEDHSPLLSEMAPKVMFAASTFTLEGVEGYVENWNDFGKWMYRDLIDGNQSLPESTITEISALVQNETQVLEKAKKIYEYVQNKTRYISVQVGIGGWKPYEASEVDKLSYGDCKALTNYTMALLDAVGIESNYTVVFSGSNKKDIQPDFASIQGNHVILSIPGEEETTWLECTSQKTPFGFIGDFTDDRDVLVITPEGGQIKHTKQYTTQENTQTTKSTSHILSDGGLEVSLEMVSKGIQYNRKYFLEAETSRDIDKHYKNRWDYINNVTIEEYNIENDKSTIAFNESVKFKATNYGNIVGDRMLVALNTINRNTYVPDRYRNRKLPLKINRGYKDVDEIEIQLPEGYNIEALPNNEVLTNKFGSYTLQIEKKDEKTLVYRRELIVNNGEFPKEDYKKFRDFYKTVAKLDNAKMALIKE
ncbi:DUF3857 domain-containing protein [uncultured Psychroserpens sp.]|uniref:DUF3857 domain-containing protein n=1 Tax=uncultured Psychroserpens sp. TaxID=255436 RepID=UPI00261AE70C|nr:DUF3857 domain-containing protein [uncultured Psychroserpens sp.]